MVCLTMKCIAYLPMKSITAIFTSELNDFRLDTWSEKKHYKHTNKHYLTFIILK